MLPGIWAFAMAFSTWQHQPVEHDLCYFSSLSLSSADPEHGITFHSLFMAGRALENGANVCIQNLGQPERAVDMYKRASELFMRNMTPDRAAEMLEKGAKYATTLIFPIVGHSCQNNKAKRICYSSLREFPRLVCMALTN